MWPWGGGGGGRGRRRGERRPRKAVKIALGTQYSVLWYCIVFPPCIEDALDLLYRAGEYLVTVVYCTVSHCHHVLRTVQYNTTSHSQRASCQWQGRAAAVAVALSRPQCMIRNGGCCAAGVAARALVGVAASPCCPSLLGGRRRGSPVAEIQFCTVR